MLEDKYIGLSLAVSGSLAIGTSFIITKEVGSLPIYPQYTLISGHLASYTTFYL